MTTARYPGQVDAPACDPHTCAIALDALVTECDVCGDAVCTGHAREPQTCACRVHCRRCPDVRGPFVGVDWGTAPGASVTYAVISQHMVLVDVRPHRDTHPKGRSRGVLGARGSGKNLIIEISDGTEILRAELDEITGTIRTITGPYASRAPGRRGRSPQQLPPWRGETWRRDRRRR